MEYKRTPNCTPNNFWCFQKPCIIGVFEGSIGGLTPVISSKKSTSSEVLFVLVLAKISPCIVRFSFVSSP